MLSVLRLALLELEKDEVQMLGRKIKALSEQIRDPVLYRRATPLVDPPELRIMRPAPLSAKILKIEFDPNL